MYGNIGINTDYRGILRMHIFVCIDNNNGMLFNNRRQSRDRILIEKVKEITGSSWLWIRDFSRTLFPDDVIVDNDMLTKAGEEDYCFVEDVPLNPYTDKIDEIYVFRWNRDYPSDTFFDNDMLKNFSLKSTEDFKGSSHEKITLERWVK
jgi:hypothetical protein